MSGLITDPSGAVIQNARVTLTNERTHADWNITSDKYGIYSLPHVPPGQYTLTVVATGFKRYEHPGITVDPAQSLALDAHLQIGNDSQVVTVNGATGYVVTDSSAGTKTDIPLIETPQSISVVTEEQIKDQQPQTLNEALRYSSGAVPESYGVARGANTNTSLIQRGFTPDMYLDGLKSWSAADLGEPYLLGRIDLLSGPASVLYGQASPGGLIDAESKRPPVVTLHEAQVGLGSYHRYEGGVDLGGPIADNKHLLYRLTGAAFREDSQVNFVQVQQFAIAPAFAWRPDERTSLTLLGRYIDTPNTGAYTAVPVYGTILPNPNGKVPVSFFLGDPDFDTRTNSLGSIGSIFEHTFSRGWAFHQGFRYAHETNNSLTLYPSGLASNLRTISRYSFRNDVDVDSILLDNNLSLNIQTGIFRQKILVGFDFQRSADHDNYALNFAGIPSIDIFAPVYYVSIPAISSQSLTHEYLPEHQFGLYGQDQIAINHWRVLLGIRNDWAHQDTQVTAAGSTTTNSTVVSSLKPTWRGGINYVFDSGVSPYVSYSTSFEPQSGTSYTGKPFIPTTGQQYEAGIKYQPRNSTNLITAAVYSLTENNVTTTDVDHQGFSTQIGKIRSRGVELQDHAQLTRNLGLIAGYTHTVSKYERANDTSTGIDGVATSIQGKYQYQVPPNMASLWTNYAFHAGFISGLGGSAGVRFIGGSFGDEANSFKVPNFTLLDAAFHYDFDEAGPRWLKGYKLQINATNLLDRTYVSSCFSSSNCYFGDRRSVYTTLRYGW